MRSFPPAPEIDEVQSCRGPKEANTDVVLRALLSHRKRNLIDPSHLPPALRQVLEENLPKKGLKAFLLKHSDKFEVQAGVGNRWTFSIKTNSTVTQPPPGLEHQNTSSSSSSSSSGWTRWRAWEDWSSWGDSGWKTDPAPDLDPLVLVQYGLVPPEAAAIHPKWTWQ